MADIATILSDNMKRLRELIGWRQADLAEAMHVSIGTVAAYEGRRRWPERPYIEAMARALGVPEAELFAVPAPPDKTETMRKDVIKLALNASPQELEGALSALGGFEESSGDSLSTAR